MTIKIIKPDEFPKNAPSESEEQVTFFNQLRKYYPDIAKVALHVKNEGKRTMAQAAKDKAEGLVTGAPDIFIAGNPSLLIELKKRSKRAKVGDNQIKFLESASKLGAECYICYGWESAWLALQKWISGRKQPSNHCLGITEKEHMMDGGMNLIIITKMKS